MDDPTVPKKAGGKLRLKVTRNPKQQQKKGKQKLSSNRSKKRAKHVSVSDSDKEGNGDEVISKTEIANEQYEAPTTSTEITTNASQSDAPTSFVRLEGQNDEHLEKSEDESTKYDNEKLGSELLSNLKGQGLDISTITSNDLQKFVADFSLARNLNSEKVNIVLKDFVESKKRLIDGLRHLLEQEISRNLKRADGEKLEVHQYSEVNTGAGKDEETQLDIQEEIEISQESDSFIEDSMIPIIRPRSPVLMFADDLSLDSIIDEGAKRTQKQEPLLDVDLFAKDSDGDTLLHIAVAKNHRFLPLLIKSMHEETLDIQNKMGHTPLHIAVIVGSNEIVQNLVFHGSSVAVMDFDGNTPLHLSCQSDDFDLTKNLVSRGVCQSSYGLEAALATRNYEGEAPLHIAMARSFESGSEKVVRCLLDLKCDINTTHRKTGKSSLLMALENKGYDLARLLIRKGADPNVASFSGMSPLHLASKAGNTSLVVELIAKGANIYAKTTDSETAKEFASNEEIKEILEKAMKKERRNRQKAKLAKRT